MDLIVLLARITFQKGSTDKQLVFIKLLIFLVSKINFDIEYFECQF